MMSPTIDELRPKILEWVNTTTGKPIEAEKLEVEWKDLIPHLKLSNVNVLDHDTKKVVAFIDEVSFSVDPFRTLTEQKVSVGHLLLSGLKVGILHKKDDSIKLKNSTRPVDRKKLIRWLLKQPHLQITNGQITWYEERWKLEPIQLHHLEINLKNKRFQLIDNQDDHLLTGSAKLEKDKGDLRIFLDIKGDPQADDWNADLKVTSTRLDLDTVVPAEFRSNIKISLQQNTLSLEKARLDSSAQIKWSKSSLKKIDGKFSLKNSDQKYSLRSNFNIMQKNDLWQIIFPQVSLSFADRNWNNFELQLELPTDFLLGASRVNALFKGILFEDLITILPDRLTAKLNPFHPGGKLDTLHIHYDGKDSLTPLDLDADFSGVSTLPQDKLPGVKNLSGHITGTPEMLSFNLDSRNLILYSLTEESEVHYQTVFDRFKGQLIWKEQSSSWSLNIPNITLENPDVSFQLTGTVNKGPSTSPEFDLQGTFFRGNIEPLVKMIPPTLLHTTLKTWLDRAIVSGRLTGGTILLRGPLDKFPFEQNEGIFEVRLQVEDGILDYFQRWPRIEEITAEILFSGRKMVITAPSAKIFDTGIFDTIVEIPDLLTSQHHLLIKGKAVGQMEDGLKFIHHSPLKSSIGKKLENIEISGPLDLDLKIDLPLNRLSETSVDGKIHLDNNTLNLGSLDIQLDSLNGLFIFENEKWSAEDLKARLFDSFVSIQLDIDNRKGHKKSEVVLSGLADRNYIINRMVQLNLKHDELKILNAISGTTSWLARLTLPSKIGDPEAKTGLLITSDLKGLNILAPSPFGKTANEKRNLKLKTTLGRNKARAITFSYNKTLKGRIALTLREGKPGLERITLHFGPGNLPDSEKTGTLIEVNGTLKELDLIAWKNFLERYFWQKKHQALSLQSLITFELDIGHLKLGTRSFSRNHIRGRSEKKSWELLIENNDLSGMVSIPWPLSQQPVKADFERLRITSTGKEKTEFDPGTIPELLLTSQQFQYNELKLGTLELHLVPEKSGLQIEKLILDSPAATINIVGNWTKFDKNQRTTLIVDANGPLLRPLLEQFDFDVSGIEGGKTRIHINAKWPGSPAEFDLARVKGHLRLEIGSGRLTEVTNRVGKVFALLSIQSLTRRLSLDFSDLFKKGFTFDSITGDFDIEAGNAYTNNLSMIGTSANIDITGRIGLVDENYDQIITVTPAVSSSLPIAGALFGGPVGAGVGAAIFLAEKIVPGLPDTIDRVLQRQYQLKGSWTDPVVKLISQKKPDSNESIPGYSRK